MSQVTRTTDLAIEIDLGGNWNLYKNQGDQGWFDLRDGWCFLWASDGMIRDYGGSEVLSTGSIAGDLKAYAEAIANADAELSAQILALAAEFS